MHPWLNDASMRNELADLVKTAGYDDLVDGVLDPHNLISCVRNRNSSTPENLDAAMVENDDTINHIPDPVSASRLPFRSFFNQRQWLIFIRCTALNMPLAL